MNCYKLLAMCTTVFMASCSAPTMEQQIDDLYERMPQEERIAQLRSMFMDDLFDESGQLDTAKCRELIPFGIGHFSQFAMQKERISQLILSQRIHVRTELDPVSRNLYGRYFS